MVLLLLSNLGFLIFPQIQVRGTGMLETDIRPAISNLLNKLPAGVSVAATETGLISAANPHLVIYDLSGLNDPVFCHGFDSNELFRRKPDVFTLVHGDYHGMNRGIFQHPDFKKYRCAVNIFPERGDQFLDATIYVNTSSPEGEKIFSVLKNAYEQYRK